MHNSPTELYHSHQFHVRNSAAGKKIGIVIIINAFVMVGEIVAGTIFGSMALLADGWHMGTHILALGITFIAYAMARKYMQDNRFAFGTWKIEILGGFSSALLLGIVGISMIAASIERLLHPVTINYNYALIVAIVGCIVNIAGAIILGAPHHHQDDGHEDHPHSHEHQDLNMRAAYMHILADALTSVCAIVALCAAKYWDWNFFDPLAGIVGALLILRWTIGLCKESGAILLDREDDSSFITSIRIAIESDGISKVSDLHVWQVARNTYACIIVLLTRQNGYTIADFKKRLAGYDNLAHITIELHYIT